MSNSKSVLRGVIDFGDGKLSEKAIGSNFSFLKNSRYEWSNPDERKIYDFIIKYHQESLEPPNALTLRDYFGPERAADYAVIEKLKDIHSAAIYERSAYRTLVNSLLEAQNQNKYLVLLTETQEIVTKGRIVDKEQLKGLVDGKKYYEQKIIDLIPANSNAITFGDVTQDVQKERDAYKVAKSNQTKVWGRFTGLEHIDLAFHGIKPGELWIHAAEPGNLKTAFATNWSYNLITRYRANVLYVSLEMKYEHLRKIMCAMHTSNGIFTKQGYAPLDYTKIRDGELTPEQEQFYDLALNDFESNRDYCRMHIWVPDRDVTVADIRNYAEQLHKNLEIGLIVIDQGELVKPPRAYKDLTSEQNAVIREMKLMAMHFNGGESIPILDLHQINRTGMTANEKNKSTPEELGQYKYRDLSYANQAERSADYITTTYAPKELIEQGYAIISCMKSRDNRKFDLGRIGVDMTCHRLRNWDPSVTGFGADMTQDDYANSGL